MSALLKRFVLMALIAFSILPSISMAGLIDIECGTRVNRRTNKVEDPQVLLSSSNRASTRVSDWTLRTSERKLSIKTVDTRGTRPTINSYLIFVQIGTSVGGAVG